MRAATPLPLASVERIVRAAEITPLPRAPALVLGAIDLAGRVLPVFDIRQRFGLPGRPLDPADQFLIARTSERAVAIVVDETQGLIEQHSAVVPARRIAGNLEQIEGVILLEDGMVLIHDLETFLSPDESRALDEALKEAPRATLRPCPKRSGPASASSLRVTPACTFPPSVA